jgi:hypothetical protein
LKTVFSSRMTLLLILVLAIGVSLKSVRSAEAYSIVCGGSVHSVSVTGTGSNCVQANSDARAEAESEADAACPTYGYCSFVYAQRSCVSDSSGSTVNADASFRCYVCQNGPCPF